MEDRYDDREDRRPYDRRKDDDDRRYRPQEKDDRRSYDRRKNEEDDRRYRPRDTKQEDDQRRYRPKEDPVERDEPKALVRPSSGSSVYDKPRAPPIIRRPVPKNERDKYDYKPVAAKQKPVSTEEEEYYDDDYEEEPIKAASTTTTTTVKPFRKPDSTENDRRFKPKRTQFRSPYKTDISESRRGQQKENEQRNDTKKQVDDLEEASRPAKRPSELEDSRRNRKRPGDDGLDNRRPPKRPIDDEENIRRPSKRPTEDLESARRTQKRPTESYDEVKTQKRPETPQRPDTYEDIRRPIKRPEVRPKYEVVNAPKSEETEEDFDDYYDDDKSTYKEKLPVLSRPSKFSPKIPSKAPSLEVVTSKPETTTKELREPVVRIVKRPFLPSRGGNPYVSRGLQPVGAKALNPDQNDQVPDVRETTSERNTFLTKVSEEEQYDDESADYKQPKEEPSIEDIFKPVTSRPRADFRLNFRSEFSTTAEPPITTHKPKESDYRNPLDINENEYDVTLNDALNPTIPNLPVRSVPTGFGSGKLIVFPIVMTNKKKYKKIKVILTGNDDNIS